jgi:uncharacterized secreted repeat protein (TIGR03808 family)
MPAMDLDRRTLLTASIAGAATVGAAVPAGAATSSSASGLDATQFGLLPDVAADQSILLQRAVDAAARARLPLLLPPARFIAVNVRLPSNAQIIGIRGATRIQSKDGGPIFISENANNLELSGLVLDGGRKSSADGRALVHLSHGMGIRISDCELVDAGRNAIALEQIGGVVSGCTISGSSDVAIHSLDARGLTISANVIRASGNAGIQVWRTAPGDDGTLIVDNRIEDTRADAGGTGQNGNAINVFRAANVMVRGNRISKAAFSAIRGNSASNIQISNNTCTQLGEVGIYAEFAFEGAVIAGNTIDGAGTGISVTNFDQGGRLAVVQGNLVRNLNSGKGAGIGIAVEADTAVTGNVIEQAPATGIALGHGQYLRDVVVTGNIVRTAGIGIAASVVQGAGSALIADNLIADTQRGAIVGFEWQKAVTGDLSKDGAGKYAQLTISGNRVR